MSDTRKWISDNGLNLYKTSLSKPVIDQGWDPHGATISVVDFNLVLRYASSWFKTRHLYRSLEELVSLNIPLDGEYREKPDVAEVILSRRDAYRLHKNAQRYLSKLKEMRILTNQIFTQDMFRVEKILLDIKLQLNSIFENRYALKDEIVQKMIDVFYPGAKEAYDAHVIAKKAINESVLQSIGYYFYVPRPSYVI